MRFLLPRGLCNRVQTVVLLNGIKMSNSAHKRTKRDLEQNIIWVDLEMSGLDVEKEHILEMACIVTNKDLDVIAESEDVIIHQPDSVLANMGQWCQDHHGQSGLTAAVRKSTISLKEAEDAMLDFVQKHSVKGASPLAGNSIHMDRLFLAKYMPRFTEHLHYRIIDVSTVKELTKRWYVSEFFKAPPKALTHRALDDIRESIEELKYYRQAVFKEPKSKT